MSDTIRSAAAELGRLGGLAGGKKGGKSRSARKLAASRANLARAREALTADRRREIAQKAAQARWAQAKPRTR